MLPKGVGPAGDVGHGGQARRVLAPILAGDSTLVNTLESTLERNSESTLESALVSTLESTLESTPESTLESTPKGTLEKIVTQSHFGAREKAYITSGCQLFTQLKNKEFLNSLSLPCWQVGGAVYWSRVNCNCKSFEMPTFEQSLSLE